MVPRSYNHGSDRDQARTERVALRAAAAPAGGLKGGPKGELSEHVERHAAGGRR